MEYEPVIGVETHVQLKTATKLFCGCEIKFHASPNSTVCPVCLGLPGCLPVLNEHALKLGVKAALALGCTVAKYTKFDRKNYFYPDLPKNYQISQYDLPLSTNGQLEINGKRVRIQRLHMEEDAGKLIHEEVGDRTLVDLNRAGVPLAEIVTMPDINSTDELLAYLKQLKTIMQYCGISDCDMEKGELRCDVNLSVRKKGQVKPGVKTEMKNLNSFKFAAAAVNYEFQRQVKAIEAGERIVLETRLYDPEKNITLPMRSKEEAHDYRYFPEPDLKPFNISDDFINAIRASLPELPEAKKARFATQYSLSEYDGAILTLEPFIADFFESSVKINNKPKSVANWVINDVAKLMNESGQHLADSKLTPAALCEIIELVEGSRITQTVAKELLNEVFRQGGSPKELVSKRGLEKVTDTASIEAAVKGVIDKNSQAVADFKSGKETALKFLVGQVMRETKGRASPQIATEILNRLLKS